MVRGAAARRVSDIDIDTYISPALDDHIVPWQSAYRTTQLLGGKSRFVLSSGGHIAGIVDPPRPKAKHWTNDALPPTPTCGWPAPPTTRRRGGLVTWIAQRAGAMVAAPKTLGSNTHPPLQDAPGTYVRTRV